MTLLMSILLGLVQGIAEFLPVSSSGHLSILQNLFGLQYSGDNNLFFDVLLHLGTLVSVCVSFRKDLRKMLSDTVNFLRDRRNGEYDEYDEVRLQPSVRTVVLVIAGTLPLLIAAPFSGRLAPLFSKTWLIGLMLIITGTILAVSNRIAVSGGKSGKTATIRDAIIIGLAQTVALIPGLSRSGVTIAVGLARGLRRDFSVKFSLLLSIPAVLGSFIITLFSALKQGIDLKLIPMYIIGAVVAAVTGFFAIRILRQIMASGRIGALTYYCWGLGALTLILTIIL
ncbi:MAG: undecaprenyl-diphosphate phosphatase [Oscillospiraceae bacterium]|jgi:undecaprenyl-diphosphatase|nr:undecaprenyl-diphosphate phosphatase [Oscillospiraceae bacterium]